MSLYFFGTKLVEFNNFKYNLLFVLLMLVNNDYDRIVVILTYEVTAGEFDHMI